MVEVPALINHTRFFIKSSSHISNCRRSLELLKYTEGFTNLFVANAQLCITEMGSNLLKYGERGEILIRAYENPARLELVQLDSGIGFNFENAVTDGYSTGGTLGTGLGAIKRTSSSISFFSEPNVCTILKSIMTDKNDYSQAAQPLEFSQIVTALEGFPISGDQIAVIEEQDETHFLCVDGLGHGPEAAKVANALCNYFKNNFKTNWPILWQELNQVAKPLRGGAVGLGRIHHQSREFSFVGKGNLQAAVHKYGDKTVHLISKPGILGQSTQMPPVQNIKLNYGNIITITSDGLKSLTSNNFPARLFQESSDIISAYLYKCLVRNTDDASILVIKAL